MSAPEGTRIGLEVHVYLRTRAKLFCPCPADFLSSPAPNSQVCETCTGQPGAKPMAPDAAAVEAALRLARALGMTPAPRAAFLRKHYFYPDLPSNYQRTSEPVATGGSLAGVRLTELHVEEDPGAYDLDAGLLDYDRSGAPLVELVTEPEISSPEHARRLLQELRLVLDHLGVGRAEAGVKADCNVSLPDGERVEVKNVNSLRNVERALSHELERQARVLAEGGRVARETRHFDEATGTTRPARAKEGEADYRYLPDPDLAPVDLARLAASLPAEETPLARRARIAAAAGVAEDEASPLLEDRALCDLFDLASRTVPPRVAFQFLLRDVRAELAFRGQRLEEARVRPHELVALLAALHEGRATPMVATRLLRDAMERRGLAEALAAELAQAGPAEDAVAQAALDALREHPKAVADWKAGRRQAVHFLVGQAMRRLKGRADADAVRAAVEAALRDAA